MKITIDAAALLAGGAEIAISTDARHTCEVSQNGRRTLKMAGLPANEYPPEPPHPGKAKKSFHFPSGELGAAQPASS